MPPCPSCQQPASKRNGRNRRGRQKYACHRCRRTFTKDTASVFSGYRWPADVILTTVRWYLSYPLSSRQVLELLAERGIDVSHRTVLDWVQAFGPQLAAEVRPSPASGRDALVRGRGVPLPQGAQTISLSRDGRRRCGRRRPDPVASQECWKREAA
jgi:transposase-like protein